MSQAASVTNGRLHGADVTFRGVSIDTRTLQQGELFIALRGPNFDGADFIDKAAASGAAGALLQAQPVAELPCIEVDDTRLALGELGADWRSRMPATVIGVTGSNGKTTLKELINACLHPVARTLATAGNLNNDIGLPLMLLRMTAEDQFAVFEMGANHAGEIAYLTALAEPHIVVINNAGPAHLEGFGSLDGVAHAKGEILQGRTRPAVAVLNADDAYFDLWCNMAADCDIVSFGCENAATVSVQDVRIGASGSTFTLQLPEASVEISLALPGAHNVPNACAAAAVALAAGLDAQQIKHGLESVQPVSGRLTPLPGLGNVQLFDDSYNANPASVIAAARFLAARPGDSYFVLGEMAELGDEAASMHAAVGKAIRDAGVDRLLATGDLTRRSVDAFGENATWFATLDELIPALSKALRPGAQVLVKGSRSMQMERVVDALRLPDGAREN